MASPDSPLVRAIREYLDRTGTSPRALSLKIGANETLVRKVLGGQVRFPRGENLTRLARELGVPAETLTPGDEAASPDEPPAPPASMTFIREYDVGAAAGGGVPEQPLDGHGNHPVLAEWTIPRDYLASFTGASSDVAIIRVEGDSMEPEYGPGERVLVDLSRKKPSPAGIFVVWDGMGLVLKRVEYVPYSDPPRIRLMSANPAYGTYEVELQEHTIVARVIGRWQWR